MSYDNDGQYSTRSILRYEQIFGRGYVSTGGETLTAWIADHLQPARRILDIGSGLGGPALMLATRFDAEVVGLDLSETMVQLSRERANDPRVTLRVANVMTEDFEPGAFDLIWSRDTFLHIADKTGLYARVHRWLAPGGQLLVTDYARGEGEPSADFEAYASDKGYDLRPPSESGRLLREAGFSSVEVIDWTDRFEQTLRDEVATLMDRRAGFLSQGFSEADLDYLIDRWHRKIGFCQQGHMKAGLWRAAR